MWCLKSDNWEFSLGCIHFSSRAITFLRFSLFLGFVAFVCWKRKWNRCVFLWNRDKSFQSYTIKYWPAILHDDHTKFHTCMNGYRRWKEYVTEHSNSYEAFYTLNYFSLITMVTLPRCTYLFLRSVRTCVLITILSLYPSCSWGTYIECK
jgi:hypothetical protein